MKGTGNQALVGLDFSESEKQLAIQEKRALVLVLQYGMGCQLSCRFCYAGIGEEIREMVRRTGVASTLLQMQDYDRILIEAAACGIKSVYVSGEGEPLIDREAFIDLINKINEKGLSPVVFTNGVLIDLPFAQSLARLNVSVIGKCLSFSPEKNNYLVGKEGIYEYVDVGGELVPSHIKFLRDVGLAQRNQLAINCVVTTLNVGEIETIWRWCRENQIFPFIEFMVQTPSMAAKSELDISDELRKACHHRIHALDNSLGIEYPLTYGPYLGNRTCDSRLNLTIDMYGNSRICACTYVPFGNVMRTSIRELIRMHYLIEQQYQRNHDNSGVHCACGKYNRTILNGR